MKLKITKVAYAAVYRYKNNSQKKGYRIMLKPIIKYFICLKNIYICNMLILVMYIHYTYYLYYKHLNTSILKFNRNYINVFLLRQTFNVNFKKKVSLN